MKIAREYDLVSKEIDELVALIDRLAVDAAASDFELPQNRVQDLLSVAARGGHLIVKLYGIDSHYMKLFEAPLKYPYFKSMHSGCYDHVSEVAGILKAVQHNIRSGMLLNIRSLLQAEIFSDFLEMAEHLLNEKYKDAAAVLLGAVLEDSLRKLADANNISCYSEAGKPLTIDPLNIALAKAQIYGPLVQKQITTWANLRNDAAHGYFLRYDEGQVQQMLLFVQKFCADFLK